MRIAIGCDDTGFPLKEQVAAALEAAREAQENPHLIHEAPVTTPVRQSVSADAGMIRPRFVSDSSSEGWMTT